MLVQFYYPKYLKPAQMDQYLSKGWFRAAHVYYRAQLICMDDGLYSVVNIRLRLPEYRFRKSLRKILNRCSGRFSVKICKARITPEKEALYQHHKHRFKGFVFDTLQDYLGDGVTNTLEICVYDQKKLAAASFFDVGKNSVASILGLFDHGYEKYSMGLYTMLLELEYATKSGKTYYYPGYILDRPSAFDYKLRLGDMEYNDWKGNWKPISRLPEEEMLIHRYERKLQSMKQLLEQQKISSSNILFPLFSVGYSLPHSDDLMRSPLYLLLHHPTLATSCNIGLNLIVEYLPAGNHYRLSHIEGPGIGQSPSNGKQAAELIYYHEILLEHIDPEAIMRKVAALG